MLGIGISVIVNWIYVVHHSAPSYSYVDIKSYPTGVDTSSGSLAMRCYYDAQDSSKNEF